MEQPDFNVGDTVFAIPCDPGWSTFNWFGLYRIISIKIVPKYYAWSEIAKDHLPVKETRFVYYGEHFAGEMELKHVFKDKAAFVEFIKAHEFPVISKSIK